MYYKVVSRQLFSAIQISSVLQMKSQIPGVCGGLTHMTTCNQAKHFSIKHLFPFIPYTCSRVFQPHVLCALFSPHLQNSSLDLVTGERIPVPSL